MRSTRKLLARRRIVRIEPPPAQEVLPQSGVSPCQGTTSLTDLYPSLELSGSVGSRSACKHSSGRWKGAVELTIEDCFPIRAEGFDEDVLHGLVVLVTRVEFAAALRLAEMDPVGGAIAGTLKARRLAERFAQNRSRTVRPLPVVQQLADRQPQRVARQMRHRDPRKQ